VSGERHIPIPSLPQIELRSFNQQPVTLVAEQLQGQSAHWIPEVQLCRTDKYFVVTPSSVLLELEANMAVPGSEHWNGGRGVYTGGN
jgi:hypothetical protein